MEPSLSELQRPQEEKTFMGRLCLRPDTALRKKIYRDAVFKKFCCTSFKLLASEFLHISLYAKLVSQLVAGRAINNPLAEVFNIYFYGTVIDTVRRLCSVYDILIFSDMGSLQHGLPSGFFFNKNRVSVRTVLIHFISISRSFIQLLFYSRVRCKILEGPIFLKKTNRAIKSVDYVML